MYVPEYTFKPKPELVWFMIVAGITVLVQLLVEFDLEVITDLRMWLVATSVAVVRAALGAFLAYAAKYGITYDADKG